MMFSTKKFNKEIEAVPQLLAMQELSPERRAAIKENIMLAIKTQHKDADVRMGFFAHYQMTMRYVVAALLGLFLVGGTAFAAAGAAQPGEALYGVKLAGEKIRLGLTVSAQSRAELKTKFAQARISELRGLAGGDDSKHNATADQNSASNKLVISPNTAATATATLAPALPQPAVSARQKQLRLKAKAEAQSEVRVALKDLRSLKLKFKAQGNVQGEFSVASDIANLQTQAKQENLSTEEQGDDAAGDRSENNQGSVQGTSTIQFLPETNGPGRGKNQERDSGRAPQN